MGLKPCKSYFMLLAGAGHVSGQFIQKVYRWAPDVQSYINSISSIVHTLATMTAVPILIRVVKLPDTQLAIIGYCTSFVTNLIKALWLSATGKNIIVKCEITPGRTPCLRSFV